MNQFLAFFSVVFLMFGCCGASQRTVGETESADKTLELCPKSECTLLPSAPPKKACKDGSTAGPTDDCYRHGDGSCRPIVHSCPE